MDRKPYEPPAVSGPLDLATLDADALDQLIDKLEGSGADESEGSPLWRARRIKRARRARPD